MSSELDERLPMEWASSIPRWLCSALCLLLILSHQICESGRRVGGKKVGLSTFSLLQWEKPLRGAFSGPCHLHYCPFCPAPSVPVFITTRDDLVVCCLSPSSLDRPLHEGRGLTPLVPSLAPTHSSFLGHARYSVFMCWMYKLMQMTAICRTFQRQKNKSLSFILFCFFWLYTNAEKAFWEIGSEPERA